MQNFIVFFFLSLNVIDHVSFLSWRILFSYTGDCEYLSGRSLFPFTMAGLYQQLAYLLTKSLTHTSQERLVIFYLNFGSFSLVHDNQILQVSSNLIFQMKYCVTKVQQKPVIEWVKCVISSFSVSLGQFGEQTVYVFMKHTGK